MRLVNRVAIVTGAASGIGKAIAFSLSKLNHMVVIADQSESGNAVAEEIKQSGGSSVFHQIDVSDQKQVQQFIQQIDKQFGKIDILVNNAGIRPTLPFKEMDFMNWDKVIKVNLYSTFICCSEVLPIMERNKWGRIINISSLAAQQGSTGGHSHYAASKAGVLGLSKSLAREYGLLGITVNVISPGWIDTPGWGGALEGNRAQLSKKIPVGRIGLPRDVADAVCFLASDQAEYITGITLPVNGGLYIS